MKPDVDAQVVSEAIVCWTGWRDKAWPAREDSRVIERFGTSALDLIPVVHSLAREFNESDAALYTEDLADVGRVAAARFKKLHPEITDDAIDALSWCYMFDSK